VCVRRLWPQELAQGRSLAQLVAAGWTADDAEVRRIAVQLLGVLEYLAGRRPPITHRCVVLATVIGKALLAARAIDRAFGRHLASHG
jgi:hypothetical protein